MPLIQRLILLLAISLLFSFFGWGRRVLFPFQVFTTWIHECWHALMAMLLGASSIKITLSADGAGVTHYKIAPSRLRQGMIASAGYLGASASGCFIFFLAMNLGKPAELWNAQAMIWVLCGMIGLSLLFWIRNAFGWVSVSVLMALIFALNDPHVHPYAQEVLLFLSIQTALNALFDIRKLLALGSSKKTASDAHTMQKLFYLPYWFWAIFWLTLSIGMMFFTVHTALHLI